MCNHARAIVNDALYSIGLTERPTSKEEAQSIGSSPAVAKRLHKMQVNSEFHMHVDRLRRFRDDGRGNVGKSGSNGAQDLIDGFFEGVKLQPDGCPGWIHKWTWDIAPTTTEAAIAQ